MTPKAGTQIRVFKGDMPGLMEACGWVEEFATGGALGDDVSNSLQVCFEELASNIVRHGSEGLWVNPKAEAVPSPLTFSVGLTLAPDKLRLMIEDNGAPFDVVAAESHGVNQTLNDLQVGGLGIHLVKSLASKLSYQRTSFGNKVTVEFSRQRVQEPSQL